MAGNKHGFEDRDLSHLSPQERAALEEDDDAPAGKEAGTEEDTAKEAKPAAEADDKKAAPATEETDEETEAEPLVVPFQHEGKVDPKVVEAKLAEDLGALKRRFDEGELDQDGYTAARDKLRDTANRAILTDEVMTRVSATSQEQTAMALWDRAVSDFLDANPLYKGDKVLYRALNETVKEIAKDEANDKISDRKLLTKAHEEVMKTFRPDEAKKPTTPEEKKAAEEAKRAVAAAKGRKEAPPALSGMPAAQDNETGESEFGQLDKLLTSDPSAYERALAKMPKDQQDRYLRGQ